jgi:hypothetical protein
VAQPLDEDRTGATDDEFGSRAAAPLVGALSPLAVRQVRRPKASTLRERHTLPEFSPDGTTVDEQRLVLGRSQFPRPVRLSPRQRRQSGYGARAVPTTTCVTAITSLLAAFNIADGTVIGRLRRLRRAIEFKKFVDRPRTRRSQDR